MAVLNFQTRTRIEGVVPTVMRMSRQKGSKLLEAVRWDGQQRRAIQKHFKDRGVVIVLRDVEDSRIELELDSPKAAVDMGRDLIEAGNWAGER